MKSIILYNISDEIRIFSNKKKAFEFAKEYDYSFSYNHFCTMLKKHHGVFFKSQLDKKSSLTHSITQKNVE